MGKLEYQPGARSYIFIFLGRIYDPSKFECPDAPIQVKNLFVFITHYSPQMIEIVPRLKSFIPDYIPTVGHVDAFIKVKIMIMSYCVLKSCYI